MRAQKKRGRISIGPGEAFPIRMHFVTFHPDVPILLMGDQTMRTLPVTVIPLFLLLSTTVQAIETSMVIDGSDVDAIVEIARNYGNAKLEAQSSGNPKITGRIGNFTYYAYFQNCSTPKSCSDINLYSGFLNSKPTEEKINAWNAGKRFGRAYIDPDGDAALEMDINLKNGVSPGNLSATFALWRLMITQFSNYLAGTPPR